MKLVLELETDEAELLNSLVFYAMLKIGPQPDLPSADWPGWREQKMAEKTTLVAVTPKDVALRLGAKMERVGAAVDRRRQAAQQ